jgi:ketosteroid isomerase-like protein
MSEPMLDLARRLFDALEAGDAAAAKALYAPGATLWNNVSQRDARAADVAAFLPVLAKRMPDRRYADRRVIPFEGGFCHRHRLTGTRRDGARVAAECCVLVSVEDGLITRMEEYLDSRQLDAVLSAG